MQLLEEVLREADFVSLPLTPGESGVDREEELALLKPTAS